MASARESGLFSPNEKIPVQCLDDPFGFRAEVIYGDESFPLYRCTPFLTVYRTQHINGRSNAEAEDTPESRHQMHDMSNADNQGPPNATPYPVWPEDTDAHNNINHLTFTDGGSPLGMAMGDIVGGSPLGMDMGGLGNYKPQQMESLVLLEEEGWDNHPRQKMKKVGKRGGKKSRRKHRQ